MLKIIAGEYRTRILRSPPDDAVTRPCTKRVKESLFNRLRGWFEDARVLDLFAGVGTLGLEAVSRGAAQVVLVERDRGVFDLLEQNIETLGCGDRARAVMVDALGRTALLVAPSPVDLVFVDPPYAMLRDASRKAMLLEALARCRDVMAESSFLVLRSPLDPDETALAIDGFDGPESHRYGKDMWVLFYEPRGATSEHE